ncbi:MAG: phosphoribosylformylglycinamidine cyclo-ligase [Desulfovibrionaceae bacterium]|nr:phosphoribosylformylglycinamidine cyclo-ligase [Desulfovibrionaceae bacterium]
MPADRTKAYTEAGVNIQAGTALVERIKKIVASTQTRGVVSDIGGFGGLFRPDLANMEEPYLVASTDGVGTKLKIAFACNRHDTVGIDLVAMSANDILVQGALPLFFLDYFATGKLDLDVTETVIKGIAQGCKLAECALLGGETAEMPDMYAQGEYDLAGFCVGIVDNARLIDGSSIRVGDAIIGIASSGLHSNGYSLVRKIVKESGLQLSDSFPLDNSQTMADVLLTPTSIYVETVRHLLRDMEIKGMAHITGGGFYDNIPRTLTERIEANIQFGSWDIPLIFQWLKTQGNLSWPEMLQIFNCGIGYILILPAEQAEEAVSRIRVFKMGAWQIGVIGKRTGDEQVKIDFEAYENQSEEVS